MLTFFHAPHSRSTAVLSLLHELDATERVQIRVTDIPRMDGSGARDPGNPHPEGKVPALLQDGQLITERGAVMVHLTTLFPEAGMAPLPGTAEWGAYLTWMAWYGAVMEPVMILSAAGVTHPWMTAAVRGPEEAYARISKALSKGPWLLGDRFSAADVLVHSPFAWNRDWLPEDAAIRDWAERCMARPAAENARAQDAAWLAARAA